MNIKGVMSLILITFLSSFSMTSITDSPMSLLFKPYYHKGNIERYKWAGKESMITLMVESNNTFQTVIFDLSSSLKLYTFGTISHQNDTLILNTSRNRSTKAKFKNYAFMNCEPIYLKKNDGNLITIVTEPFIRRKGSGSFLER
jgi:hypothetical protein